MVAVMCLACMWSNGSPENERQLTSPFAALENYLEFVCFDPKCNISAGTKFSYPFICQIVSVHSQKEGT